MRAQLSAMLTGMELGLATFADLSSGITPRAAHAQPAWRRSSSPTSSASTCSPSASTTAPDFLDLLAAVALAAAAVRTERIRLSSAVTVLSSDDPVRVFQDFAEVDLLSGGRAEIMAGRGSFIESFPLFGYDLDDYDELYAEKLDLLLRDPRRRPRHLVRPPPRAARRRRASGRGRSRTRCPSGSPSAARRSRSSAPGTLGLPLTIAIIGGQPERFVPLVDLYREACERRAATTPADAGSRSTPTRSSARRPREADAAFAAPYLAMMNRIGRERGWPPSGAGRVRGAALAARRAGRRLARAGRREDPVRARAVRPPALHRAR